jgi:hypothetical protein
MDDGGDAEDDLFSSSPTIIEISGLATICKLTLIPGKGVL